MWLEAGLVKVTDQEAEAGQESSITVPMAGEEFDQTDRAAAVTAKGQKSRRPKESSAQLQTGRSSLTDHRSRRSLGSLSSALGHRYGFPRISLA